jgi:NAD(P)H-dependent flavin oxidoreductase YrpB (nitropropane dioxygenase family)
MQASFTRALGLRYPIVQAPMAGANATPPGLVVAYENRSSVRHQLLRTHFCPGCARRRESATAQLIRRLVAETEATRLMLTQSETLS